MELDEYLPVLEKTNRRFADAAAEAVLSRGWTAPVPGCPGWHASLSAARGHRRPRRAAARAGDSPPGVTRRYFVWDRPSTRRDGACDVECRRQDRCRVTPSDQ